MKMKLLIGSYLISGADLIKKINRIFYKEKQDLSTEYKSLISELKDYEDLVAKAQKKSVFPKVFKILLILSAGVTLHFKPELIGEEQNKYILFIALGTIATWITTFVSHSKKKNKNLEDIKLVFGDKLLCPKCGYKLTLKSSYSWMKRGKCFGEKCDAFFNTNEE